MLTKSSNACWTKKKPKQRVAQRTGFSAGALLPADEPERSALLKLSNLKGKCMNKDKKDLKILI